MRVQEKANIIQELKRNIVIEQLLDLGISQVENVSTYDLGYMDLRRLLTIAVLRKGL